MNARRKILFVEDDRAYREILRHELGDRFELVEADTLAGALKLLAEQTFDAVLLDLGLPDSFWKETIARLRVAFPGAIIIVLTGYADPDFVSAAMRDGADSYLLKGRHEGAPAMESVIRLAIAHRDACQKLDRAAENLTGGKE